MSSPRLTSFVTRRPVAIFMVFLAAVVFGALSYGRLPLTLMPDLSYPTLTVRTVYPGAAPEEVENDVTRPIEEALGVVGGLRRMSSVSRAGVSDVVLEFAWDVAMSDALQDTLEKLDRTFLPDEAERPLILRFDPSLDPVMELSLGGEGDRFQGEEGLRRLRRLAELQVKRALEPIKGVAAVRVRGGLEEEIHVLLDAQKLRRARLSTDDVIRRLSEENINVAGGTLKEGRTEYMVRTVNEYESLEQIADTVIATLGGEARDAGGPFAATSAMAPAAAQGSPPPDSLASGSGRREIRVRDLGRVVRAHKEREILTRAQGQESVQLEIFKEADANMVALAHRVHAAVGELDLERERILARGETPPPTKQPWWQRVGGAQPPAPGLAANLFRNEGAILQIIADRSVFIEGSIREVRDTAILGGLLAVLVLYLFLRNVRTTLIVAASIPLSLFIAFAPLNSLGVSLNIMSLGGLALGVGMLVDSSIVVLESIFRCREEGDDLVTGAVRGTEEVRGAVVASILTSIAVFFPMVFVEGIAGQAFGDLALAVVISLLASLAVALLFIPMLASRQGVARDRLGGRSQSWRELAAWKGFRRDADRAREWHRDPESWARLRFLKPLAFLVAVLFFALRLVVGAVLEVVSKLLLAIVAGLVWLGRRFLWPVVVAAFRLLSRPLVRLTESGLLTLSKLYPPVLRWGLAHPATVVAMAAATFFASWWMLQGLDTELLPEVHQGEFTVEVALPVGTPLEETDAALAEVERAILQDAAKGFGPLKGLHSLLLTVGYDPSTSQRSDEGEHTARFKVLLDSMPSEEEDLVVEELRRRFASIPDVDTRVTRPVLFSFKTPIEVEIHGDDLARLREKSQQARQALAALPSLADVETTQRQGAPEVQILYDRDLLTRYQLGISQVADLVRNQVRGFEATLYNLRDRRIPIVVRLEEQDRHSTQNLKELAVNPGGEKPILLSSVAQVQLGEGPSEVRRIDGRRVALVRANLGAASLGRAVTDIEETLSRAVEWPADMAFVVSGQSQEWERSQRSLWLALSLSIFLVYVIMAAQFESLLHPLVILFTIPLAFFGTVGTLRLLDINLSIVVFLGMIMLAGIVVNNAIVLVDYINVLKRRGMDRDEAIVTAGRVRLRPILMTTATTVLGLTPMALGLGEGAEIRTPMALAVVGGLIASTLLTLLIVPVVYAIVDRLQARVVGRETWAPSSDRLPQDGEEDATQEVAGTTLRPASLPDSGGSWS